jgi:heterodisulfide reductase subunit A
MARIGIFIDTLQGSLPSSFCEKIAAHIQTMPNIAFCSMGKNLTSSEDLEKMFTHLQPDRADRIVIIGGSPKIYEAAFHKLKFRLPLNPYLFAVANVREQALWAMKDEEMAMEKARTLIDKAVRTVSHSKPIETQSLTLKPEVLILGGGIVGISIALALAQSGVHVTLLEKGPRLGGMALELRKFYDRPQEVQKWIEEKLSEVNQTPHLTIFTQTELERVEGHLGRFQATIRNHNGLETVLHISAIVVATGIETRPEMQSIYQYKKVIGLAEMEKLLSETTGPNLSREGRKIEMITFLLDGVNEDIKIDSINAIKQALLLQENFHCQVAILSKEVKVAADGMERLYRKTRERGALFFKYDEPPRLSMVNGQIQIEVKDTAAIQKKEQWPVSILSDLLVISKAFIPAPETERIANQLKLRLGPRGFLMEDNPQFLRVRSNRKGIFVAGGCRFPQEISESMIEAKAVVQEVMALFSNEIYSYDLSVAEVDPNKCAVCYTCPRLCPHAAITVEKYAEKNVYRISQPGEEVKWGAAKVDPVACFGCGICVAECPAKAITLRHLTDEQIYAQMGLNE